MRRGRGGVPDRTPGYLLGGTNHGGFQRHVSPESPLCGSCLTDRAPSVLFPGTPLAQRGSLEKAERGPRLGSGEGMAPHAGG